MFKARTSKVQLYVYVFTIVSFKNCFSSTTEQAVDLVRNFEGDYFANPEGSCNARACGVYNSKSVGGYCYSTGVCCSQCCCPKTAPTYVLHLKQCMSLMTFVKEQIPDEIYYLLGNPGAKCNETCHDAGGNCVSQGHGFNDAKTTLSIFSRQNVSCKTSLDTDTYKYSDNPTLAIGGNWKDRCIGFKNVRKTIYCKAGGNELMRRLCPCKGTYWLVENSCDLRFSKMSLLYLNTESNIRLKLCDHSNTHSLLNCVVEQIIYLQGSHWINLGEKAKDLFDVKTVQGFTNVIELKWNKLGNHYDGIIGYIQIKCDLNEGISKLSFVFKSSGSSTFMRHMNIVTSSFLSSTSKVYIDTKVAVHPTTKFEGKNWKPTKGSGSSVPVPAIAGGIAAAMISVIVIIVFLVCRRKRMRKNEEFRDQDLNGQLHQDENEPPENGPVYLAILPPSSEEAATDYVIPCQTKNSEISSKENSAAAGSNPSCPDPESESEWDYEEMGGPTYQELQNRPSNTENCHYAKLQIRHQTLSPMQIE